MEQPTRDGAIFVTERARWSFGRAVVAANRPDLCTFCLSPKIEPPGTDAETGRPCHSGQHRKGLGVE